MALGADLTTRPPPARIPKLKYRIPLPPVETSPSSDRQLEILSPSSNAQQPPATPSSQASSFDNRPSFDTASVTSPSLASTTSSASSSNDSKSPGAKKKKGSVFGFLSLKEPSQRALEQYAEAQRKQMSEKGTSSPTARSDNGYASKKLPPTVPKVNSKWDGVPDGIKHLQPGSSEKSSGKSSGKNKNRLSVTSQTSQGSNDTRITALSWEGSKRSEIADNGRHQPDSAQSSSDFTIRGEGRSASPSPSTTNLPEMSYYFPEPLPVHSPSKQSSQPESHRPVVVEAPPRPSISSSEFDLQLNQLSERADSPTSSVDSSDTVVRDTADGIFKKLNDRPHKSIWGDTSAAQPPDASHEVVIPESHDFLFNDQVPGAPKNDSPMSSPPTHQQSPKRPVPNFSRPVLSSKSPVQSNTTTTPYRNTRSNSAALPTLYEASLAGTDVDETYQEDGDYADDDTYSIAPSTIAPSVLSSHWHDSPRERLGLGGRLSINEVLPWESGKDMPGKPKKSRLSMVFKGTSSRS
jgi:hypothetical protein